MRALARFSPVLTDTDGKRSVSLTAMVALLVVAITLTWLHALGYTKSGGAAAMGAIWTAYATTSGLYYKRRQERDAHALKLATIRAKGTPDGPDA